MISHTPINLKKFDKKLQLQLDQDFTQILKEYYAFGNNQCSNKFRGFHKDKFMRIKNGYAYHKS